MQPPMPSESPHQKPDVSLAHLGGLDVDPGRLADLLDGHVELAETHLGGQPLNGGGQAVGVGITEHRIDGQGTGRPALLVLVDDAKALEGGLPSENGRGVPIVYQVSGQITACATNAGRYRPAGGGVSIAPAGLGYSGTLGCVVAMNGRRFILGCNHVLANCNRLPLGAAILQPSMADGGQPTDVIAELAAYVPLNFSVNQTTPTNAAIAAVTSDALVDPRITRNGGVMQSLVAPIVPPIVGLRVQKSGRSSGDSQGHVTMVGLSIKIMFPPTGIAILPNLFSVEGTASGQGYAPFAMAGDSGALVTTSPANQPVGMVMATASAAAPPLTFAGPITGILNALQAQTGQAVTVVYG